MQQAMYENGKKCEYDREERLQEHERWPNDGLIGNSPAMQHVRTLIHRAASTNVTVLLAGESGTGKEVAAQLIHRFSLRANKPFVAVSCAAFSEGVLESELFGHERGAFTGAINQHYGCFERANGGTLFLDEIGDISPTVQVKLLRVLQEQTFERVGGEKSIRVGVRLLAATNQDLEAKMVERGFREDLYYRLNVFPIRLPPLRERPEDIPLLVEHCLTQYQNSLVDPCRVSGEAMAALIAYPWPGNVRELEHVLQRAVILADGPVIGSDDLQLAGKRDGRCRGQDAWESYLADRLGIGFSLKAELAAYECTALRIALQRANGHLDLASHLLGLPYTTFVSKVRKYQQHMGDST